MTEYKSKVKYEAPIEINIEEDFPDPGAMAVSEIENMISSAVLKVGITVDKEELIKALRYDRGQYEKGYADGKCDAAAAIEALEAKVPHWVSVKDELPPMLYQAEGDDFCIDYSLLVLAYREASHDFWLARQMDDGHGATWGTDCFDELYGVTHWMPLPEPPQEDEHGN